MAVRPIVLCVTKSLYYITILSYLHLVISCVVYGCYCNDNIASNIEIDEYTTCIYQIDILCYLHFQ